MKELLGEMEGTAMVTFYGRRVRKLKPVTEQRKVTGTPEEFTFDATLPRKFIDGDWVTIVLAEPVRGEKCGHSVQEQK